MAFLLLALGLVGGVICFLGGLWVSAGGLSLGFVLLLVR